MVSATFRPALAGPSLMTVPGPATGGVMRCGDSVVAAVAVRAGSGAGEAVVG
jgi:hypothetical protein